MENISDKICLVLPSMSTGGMERVMSQLASYFDQNNKYSVYLIILTKQEKFFNLPENITIIEPNFNYRENSRLIFTWKILQFLRATIKKISPNIILSFGGKYNGFVILSLIGVRSKIFVSDRSQPGKKYGVIQDFLNPFIYKYAHGIIAQTSKAKEHLFRSTRHKNIKVIGNPISTCTACDQYKRENIILNVGRFITTKHQDWLIEYFDKINNPHWKLVFIGDGPCFDSVKKKAEFLKSAERITFLGKISDVNEYYCKSKIFAFTSVSEGFPNVLGEAMAGGLACVSFDCSAGPSDLIENGNNGFLIEEGLHDEYVLKLKLLMSDESLRQKFSFNAIEKIKEYDVEKIGFSFLDFFESNENIN